MRYRCPVCGYPSLPYPPSDYHICPCCSTEFGNDDADYSHAQLREMWIAGGASWFFGRAPEHWNPWTQLITAGSGFDAYVLDEFRSVRFQTNAVAPPTEHSAHLNYLLANQEQYTVQIAA